MPNAGADSLEPSVYGFVLRYSLRDQIYLVLVTLISFPFLYYSLELPKTIVNNAIGGKHFPETFLGFQFQQVPYLLLLSGIFLLLVVINGWFKYHINVRKGRVGERMLRRLRYEMFERVLRFPLRHFDKTATGQIIAMITAELEPIGGFIGDAFALPISQFGTLMTILIFMFVQNPVLGAAAIALYPVQGYIIPKLQRRIRQLGRERVRKVRHLSDRISESIAGQVDIRVNHGSPLQLADIAGRLGDIYDLRFEIYNRKFFVKFLNNFLGQLTPFFFYAIGGYFVITNRLTFGALVAVLAAYKDMSSPWKELLDFYQNQQDVAIKYEQVVEQFQVADMLDRSQLLDHSEPVPSFKGEVAVANVSFVDSDGIRMLDGLSFEFPLGQHVAVVGASNSGKNLLPQLFARLQLPSSGRITVGGTDINTLPQSVTGRRLGYVGPTTHLFSAALRDNLLLGLRHRPRERDPQQIDRERARAIEEARSSGNVDFDLAADWIDYEQAGVKDAAALETRILDVLRLVDLDRDVHQLGLRGRLDPHNQPDAAGRIVEARRLLHHRLQQSGLAALVERFDPERYSTSSSVAVNLLFGTPIGHVFADESLAANRYVLSVLDRLGLTSDLLTAGAQVAEMMVELFGDLPPEHDFVQEFGFIGADDLPRLERILARRAKVGLGRLSAQDRSQLLSLAFKIIAARDRTGLIDEAMQQRILQARRAFADGLPEALRDKVEFFDPERYNAAARIEENILFGTILRGEADSRERVQDAMAEVLDELDLRRMVARVGLEYEVGTGGSRLSPAQRQKAAIARAVLKRPDLLALDEATAVLDPAAEAQIIEALKRELVGRSIVASLPRPDLARFFDQVIAMEHGRIVRQGPFEPLKEGEGSPALLAAQ
ncbi:MAG: ATP-binding cassette domain-containing protein [Alphaproteobacteria bacterium]|nr:ATP-binding cassette domain-containing protein [Alphaproteobacteria bacterium]